MFTKNEVAQMALARLGISSTVINIDTENSKEARVLKRMLRASLDTVLEMHEWNFATRFSALTVSQENPANSAFRFEYNMPADCLIVRDLAPNGCFPDRDQYQDRQILFTEIGTGVGIKIQTNLEDAHARYTMKVPENFSFPTHFARAFAAQWSLDVAPQLILGNFAQLANSINSTARADISEGIANDLARTPPARLPENAFIRAMRG